MTETRPMKTAPKITWRYVDDGGELALFWTSPWNGTEEKIATFWWPGHPPEATEEVEKMFEAIAARACLGSGPLINEAALAARLGPSVLEQLEGADARPLRSEVTRKKTHCCICHSAFKDGEPIRLEAYAHEHCHPKAEVSGSGSSVGRAPKQGDARHDCETHQDRMPGNATEAVGSSPAQILTPKTAPDNQMDYPPAAVHLDRSMVSVHGSDGCSSCDTGRITIYAASRQCLDCRTRRPTRSGA